MAAGLGFKTFTTGEVLTAADVNGYLMQGVLVFASEAARNSAITSPQEGQFAYTKDNNSLWYYTGSAWAASGATGDIEGVTAGVGISGGGTSGTVTITNDMATTITASGDIVVGTGSGTYDNLPIGTTGQVLTADTTVSPYKVKWASAASGGGMTVIASGNLSTSSSTLVLSSIPGTYYNLQLVIRDIYPTNNNKNLAVTVNSVTDNDFFYYNGAGVGAIYANATINVIAGGMANTNDQNYLIIDFLDYANTDSAKCIESVLKYNQDGGTNGVIAKISGAANTTSAITSITITMGGSDNFGAAGSYVLYGVK